MAYELNLSKIILKPQKSSWSLLKRNETFLQLLLGVEAGSLIHSHHHDPQSFAISKKQSFLGQIFHRFKKMSSYSASDRQDADSIAITGLGLLSLTALGKYPLLSTIILP